MIQQISQPSLTTSLVYFWCVYIDVVILELFAPLWIINGRASALIPCVSLTHPSPSSHSSQSSLKELFLHLLLSLSEQHPSRPAPLKIPYLKILSPPLLPKSLAFSMYTPVISLTTPFFPLLSTRGNLFLSHSLLPTSSTTCSPPFLSYLSSFVL